MLVCYLCHHVTEALVIGTCFVYCRDRDLRVESAMVQKSGQVLYHAYMNHASRLPEQMVTLVTQFGKVCKCHIFCKCMDFPGIVFFNVLQVPAIS